MKLLLVIATSRLGQFIRRDEGQDLVEYSLIVALLCFAATAGMGQLAGSVNNAFSSIAGLMTIA
jgi:pilus assembly protein Flp/PilA